MRRVLILIVPLLLVLSCNKNTTTDIDEIARITAQLYFEEYGIPNNSYIPEKTEVYYKSLNDSIVILKCFFNTGTSLESESFKNFYFDSIQYVFALGPDDIAASAPIIFSENTDIIKYGEHGMRHTIKHQSFSGEDMMKIKDYTIRFAIYNFIADSPDSKDESARYKTWKELKDRVKR